MSPAHWQNWCGLVDCAPAAFEMPSSVDEVVRVVKDAARAGRRIRVAGSGHSFTDLVKTNETLISLDRLQGIEQVDKSNHRATALAGTKLWHLNELLDEQGLAMENLGDINKQSIAGAVSTGTHGTGIRYGNIPTQVIALTLVTADGSVIECSEEKDRDLFKAAQVSVGSFGIIVKVRLRLQGAYNLRYVRKRSTIDDCAAHIAEYRDNNRHFEFYWFPFSETCQLKFLNETDAPAQKGGVRKFLTDVVLENAAFGAMSRLCRMRPTTCKKISQMSANLVSEGDEVHRAHQVFSTPRLVRFYEMEYGLPAEKGIEALYEIKKWIADNDIRVHFPVEFRFVKGDDIYLSTAHGRDTAFIAVHMYQGMPYKEYFAGVEAIHRRHGGRPHWGKLHTRTPAELATLYPMWEKFHQIRRQLDPKGMFINPYLESIFGKA